MSITRDIRTYADTAIAQGKQVLDQAQSQVIGVTGKATVAVNDLRTQAEKAVNLNAIKTAVEPYLAQAKDYSSTVTDRAEGLLRTAKNDKRVSLVVAKAEELTGTVVSTVQVRVVKPVQSLTNRGGKPAAKPSASTKPVATTKPVVTTASATTTAPKATATTKPAARKAPAKKAPTTI